MQVNGTPPRATGSTAARLNYIEKSKSNNRKWWESEIRDSKVDVSNILNSKGDLLSKQKRLTSVINKTCRSLSEACSVLQQMEAKGIKPNEVTYTSIINKHCRDLNKALEFLNQMEVKGISPDEVTYNSIINTHCLDLDKALEFLRQM